MNTRLFTGVLLAFGAPILASAQCPAGVTPATTLVGKTYAFHLDNFFVASIGTFTAQPNGYLAITETLVDSLANRVSRLTPTSGRWLSNATCDGGTLEFMLNGAHFQLTYAFAPGGQTEMILTGRDESLGQGGFPVPVQHSELSGCVGGVPDLIQPNCMGPGMIPYGPPTDLAELTGSARLSPPKACPAGLGNPLNLINGKRFSYFLNQGNIGGIPLGVAETGVLAASFSNPFAYAGNLAVENRALVVHTGVAADRVDAPVANYPLSGRYIIYPDCSGGEFLILGQPVPIQVEFVFSKADFSEVFLLLDDRAIPYYGTGTRQ
jgi:hypothetical protein